VPDLTGTSDDTSPGVTGENVVAQTRGPGGVPLFPVARGLDFYGVLGTTVVGTAGVAGRGGDNGVFGTTANKRGSGVYGENNGGGFGIAGRSKRPGGVGVLGEGARLAGLFTGNVEATGDLLVGGSIEVKGEIRFLGGDTAEEFRATAGRQIPKGSVLVIADEDLLEMSSQPYDRRVAGVVADAGNYRAAIVLNRLGDEVDRVRITLSGKVYCRVDARTVPIAVGDLLTTSATPGCAMKATEWPQAFGATIGKALAPLARGQGLIPILANLQ
jgi:hypothetical protein